MTTLQLTLGTGPTALIGAVSQAGPIPPSATSSSLYLQNNSASTMRVGDASVTASRGIVIAANGGSFTITPPLEYVSSLSDFYVVGTAGTVLDILLFG